MAILSKGTTFAATTQLTSTALNNLVDNATFDDPADEATITKLSNGKLGLADGGITSAKFSANCVTPASVDDDNSSYFTMNKVEGKITKQTAYSFTNTTSTLSIDIDNGNFQIITLTTANITTVSTPSNMEAGQTYTFILKNTGGQSATGWSSNWKWFGSVDPALTGTAGSVDIITAISDGTDIYATILKNFGEEA